MLKRRLILLGVLMLWTAPSMAQGNKTKVTFQSLLEEMVDREALTKHPKGLWTLHQVSSYDKRADDGDMFANEDWSNFYGNEKYNGKDVQIIMDVKGPGAITRIWMTGDPNAKHALRFFIDGAEIPFWEADHVGALIGQNAEIGYPLSFRSVDRDDLPINKGAKPGHNLYAPIPFEKSIKITYEGPKEKKGPFEGLFWNINYRLYHGKVDVESFNSETPNKYAATLKAVNDKLEKFQSISTFDAKMQGEAVENKNWWGEVIGAKQAVDMSIRGAKAINSLRVYLDAEDIDKALQEMLLRISFDGEETVICPFGLFFGSGDQAVPAKDYYRKVDEGANMASFWLMPFKTNAKISFANTTDKPIKVNYRVSTTPYKWVENSMYFHTMYKERPNFQVEAAKGLDLEFLKIDKGVGVYVGDTYQIYKPFGVWWGEGDEKIYIDGSKFPDHFGTGTEDYYGYAWGHPELYNHVFISQPIGDANTLKGPGITVNSRVRLLDGIPFSKSLDFQMEKWGWTTRTVDIKWATFWYQK
ncbi:glycoside hydrolase family 172 protein [Ulvibacterium sp.]|uniref:glycoside hydrolase family 172 protein n=1 Tax=Ulvibacterium sp. TaxID=2665914 RepID=UPI00260C527D|nr:glycoside hydrolase family 172 protein [Ulvibacterium sp.]